MLGILECAVTNHQASATLMYMSGGFKVITLLGSSRCRLGVSCAEPLADVELCSRLPLLHLLPSRRGRTSRMRLSPFRPPTITRATTSTPSGNPPLSLLCPRRFLALQSPSTRSRRASRARRRVETRRARAADTESVCRRARLARRVSCVHAARRRTRRAGRNNGLVLLVSARM